jgi:uncharacterized protein YggT (Ycf19 family)
MLLAYGSIMSFSIILSWVPGAYEIKIFRLVRSISDFYLGDFRGKIIIGFLDLTPMIGLMIYSFIVSTFSMWIWM